MTKWTETDQALFNTIAQMSQGRLLKSMRKYLKKYYPADKIHATKDYILCEGNIPIMFVAHMDTVFKIQPQHIYYDAKQHVMWSPEGLGADDRAGVYLIWRIVQAGYKPHICLTTDEERGSIGAVQLTRDIKTCPFDIKYIVELDRQGTNDCVFYSCANEKFKDFVEDYGFVTDWGTFSDISEICPIWRIAGVNLSVGYKGEHHETEILNTHAMLDTFKKVCKMMDNIKEAPYFEYIPDPYERYYFNLGRKYLSQYYNYDFPIDDDDYLPVMNSKKSCQCVKCKKIYDESDVFPVIAKNYDGVRYYCIDCVSTGVGWCDKCGEPFELSSDTDVICPECSGKKRPITAIG